MTISLASAALFPPLLAAEGTADLFVRPAPQTTEELRGRTIGSDGAPLAGALVTIEGTARTTVTDQEGNFRIGNLRPGRYRLIVRMIGFHPGEAVVAVPVSGPVRIVLESAPLQLTEVVATANPTGGTANYQAAQVLRTEELQRLSAPSVGAMLEAQPGVATRSYGAAPARPVIRGFDGERVVVLENGERMGDTQERAPDDAVSLDPLAIERIEIVRGPASLLYGSSALGGVVNLFTRDLPDVWSPGTTGDLALDGATVNSMVAGSARILHGTDRWAVTARGSIRNGDDANTPSGVMPNSHLATLSGAAGIGYQSDRFRGGFSLGHHTQEYGIPEFAVVSVPGGGFAEEEPDGEVLIQRTSLQTRGEWSLDRWVHHIQFRTSANLSEQEEGDDDDDEGEDAEDEAEVEVEQLINTRTFGSTVLLRHGAVRFIDEGAFGLNLRYQHQEIEGLEAYHPGQRLVSVGTFFFEEAPLSSRLRLQFGARAEHEWVRTLPNRFFSSEQTSDATALNLSGSIGLNFRPSDQLELGAQLARAHRNPTVVERFASGWDVGAARVEIGEPNLASEVGHGVDLFGRFGGFGIRGEVALFGYWIDDFVALRNLPLGCGEIEFRVRPDRDFPPCVQYHSADARMLGGEAEIDVPLRESIRLLGAADYVRGDRRDGGGGPLAFVPPPRLRVGLTHDGRTFVAGAHLRHVLPQRRVAEEEMPTPGYTLLNLEGGVRFSRTARHTLILRLDNALDTEYSDHLSVIRRFPEPVNPENPVRFAMPGRNLNLAYRYRF